MNNDIKEIIDVVNEKWNDYYIDDFLSGEDIKKLVDYITNLQEENERLKEELTILDNYSKYYLDRLRELKEGKE